MDPSPRATELENLLLEKSRAALGLAYMRLTLSPAAPSPTAMDMRMEGEDTDPATYKPGEWTPIIRANKSGQPGPETLVAHVQSLFQLTLPGLLSALQMTLRLRLSRRPTALSNICALHAQSHCEVNNFFYSLPAP
ncbi:hypothetical protein HPB50_021205 [Hyalomma asiaticum]|uniref:Uncharacterized protein n=1 Tax=Hyalomma asiaticum TaxID=266040 RepID=A0ACB7RWU3_HYAAI|nr:hypothetical protein HPB50_021205 [Hyalomma asiaticum]